MNKIWYFLLLLMLGSCIKIKGELKGLYSYFDKTDKLYPGLLAKPSGNPVCSLIQAETPKVYIINGKQIHDCLARSENAALYFWQPLCHGEFCYAIDVVQRECNKKNLDLYIVSEYYDGESMNRQYTITHPIFGIDIKYYGSSLCDNYVPKFMEDVTGKKIRNVKFIVFKNGSVQRIFNRIEEL